MKHCNSCGKDKGKPEFGARKASSDGLSAKCKVCASEYDRSRMSEPHRIKARLDYASTKEGRAAGGRAKKLWAKNNLIKRAASTIVGNAVRDGKLEKPSACSACGNNPKRLHGHHDDYAFPLTVRWLCPGCHSAWHNRNGTGANG